MSQYLVPTPVPEGTLITLNQVQAIQGASAPRRLGPAPPDWRKFRRVRAGTLIGIRYGPTSTRTGMPTRGLCGPTVIVVACPPRPKPVVDRDAAETTAAGVAEGLRRAPLISNEPVPWIEPGFRSQRYPRTARVVLSTFGAANTRTVQLQRAMAGYIGTTNAVIATAVPAALTPVAVISFQCPDSYRGDRVVVACQDHQILYLSQWTVTINGRNASGPFFLIGGEAPINVNARRDDTVALNIIVPTGDSFAVPVEALVEGWIYPSVNQTDGTYSKVLRRSPDWSAEEGMPL